MTIISCFVHKIRSNTWMTLSPMDGLAKKPYLMLTIVITMSISQNQAGDLKVGMIGSPELSDQRPDQSILVRMLLSIVQIHTHFNSNHIRQAKTQQPMFKHNKISGWRTTNTHSTICLERKRWIFRSWLMTTLLEELFIKHFLILGAIIDGILPFLVRL